MMQRGFCRRPRRFACMHGLPLAFLLVASVAAAQIELQLETPTLHLARGTSAVLRARLANTAGVPIYLKGVGHDLPVSLLPNQSLDAFLAARPDSLQMEEVWTGTLAELTVALDAPIGPETYEITLLGGGGSESSDALGRVFFEVDVYDAACAPNIVTQPQPVSAPLGTAATLAASTGGGAPTSYQWRHDGLDILDDDHVTGTQSALLEFSQIAASDSGAYELLASNDCGGVMSLPVFVQVTTTLGVPRPSGRPTLALAPPRPNPARASVLLAWSLASAGQLRLDILDVTGRRVRTLAHGRYAAGPGRVTWDGAASTGQRAAPGLYFARLDAGGRTLVEKLTLLW